jgi:hypothetical protein
MQKEENGAKTDVVKLFIVLMAISTVGFAVGAIYLRHAQSTYASLVDTEKKCLTAIKRIVENTENNEYWGFESKGASRTTGADLAPYLIKKASTHGIPLEDYRIDDEPHAIRGYKETKANLKLADVTLEQVVRYLYNIQQGKNDIFISSLRLSNFDYEQPIPICKATVDAVVFEEMKTPSKK